MPFLSQFTFLDFLVLVLKYFNSFECDVFSRIIIEKKMLSLNVQIFQQLKEVIVDDWLCTHINIVVSTYFIFLIFASITFFYFFQLLVYKLMC